MTRSAFLRFSSCPEIGEQKLSVIFETFWFDVFFFTYYTWNLVDLRTYFNFCFSFLENDYKIKMSKRRIDIRDSSDLKKTRDDSGSVSSLKPGLKINPYNANPYTPRYFELFRKRIGLPVWEYQEKFLELLNKHQTICLVGETGSGKTTQVSAYKFSSKIFSLSL